MATILSINSTTEITGGADRFCSELNKLMVENGERIVTFSCKPSFPVESVHPRLIHYFANKAVYPKGTINKISSLINVFYDPGTLKFLEKLILAEKPAIAHIHNIYHRIPYDAIDMLNRYGIRIIWWLHDYKWLCPNHQLFTQGGLCQRCRGGHYYNAVLHRCQINSVFKSIVACCFAYFVAKKRYHDRVDRYIAPSQCAYAQFKMFDFPISKVKVLPHFFYSSGTPSQNSPVTIASGKKQPYALYVGRIEENKGLLHLVQAFGKSGFPLKIVGTGNLEVRLKDLCYRNRFSSIEFIGYISPEELPSYYLDSLFVIVPSVWYEVFGLSILEAFSHSKPVVASDIGAAAEILEVGKTGLLYRTGDIEDLTQKTKWMFDNPESARQMGLNAQKIASQRFSSEKYWELLNTLHRELCGH